MKTKSGNEVTFDQATELYILRDDKAWSWYELAERYNITINDAREIFEAAKSGNLEFDDEEADPFGDGGIYSLYGSSDSIPTADNFKDAAADPDDLEELEETINYRPTEPYHRCELLAYLGDCADDYDIDAIEDEATEWHDCELYWRADVDLWEICEHHELYQYVPAV